MFFEEPTFKMYVKSGCPFCEEARKIILTDLQASLHLIDVTRQPDLREMIIHNTGQKTVPAIYLGGEFIGGCDDLKALVESDEIRMKILVEENRALKEENERLRRSL